MINKKNPKLNKANIIKDKRRENKKFDTIEEYEGCVFFGKLDLNNKLVIDMTEKACRLFLNSPPEHFIGTFLYFYHLSPEQENPITVTALDERIDTHPGQGRLIANYLKGEKYIDSILIPLNEQPKDIMVLKSIAKDVTCYSETVYNYDNENHHGISTKNFESYFYPTNIRLRYEKKKDKLLYKLLNDYLPILWKFKDRTNIKLGDGSVKTVIKCKNAMGFYESVANLALGHFNGSKNYGIKTND